MTDLANYLSIFLREYLPCDRGVSQNTSETYAYTFQLLVCFAARLKKIQPSKLTLESINATLVSRWRLIAFYELKNKLLNTIFLTFYISKRIFPSLLCEMVLRSGAVR